MQRAYKVDDPFMISLMQLETFGRDHSPDLLESCFMMELSSGEQSDKVDRTTADTMNDKVKDKYAK